METSLDNRLRLHEKLVRAMNGPKVYFQPPENIKITRPCIIYKLTDIQDTYADNEPFLRRRKYEVLLVDDDPDSKYIDILKDSFDYIRFTRFYVADTNNHWLFELYF